MNPRTTSLLLFGAAILTLMGTGIQIFGKLPADGPRLANLALLFAFAVILVVAIMRRGNLVVARSYLVAGPLLILAIFLINDPDIGDECFTLFFVLTSCAALFLPLREAVVWAIALVLVQMAFIVYGFGWSSLLSWGSVLGGHFMFAGFGYLMRQSNVAREQTEQLYSELQEAYAKLQTLSAQSQQLAVAEERNRLAREMHDSLGHRLTVAILQLEGAQKLIESEPTRASNMVGNMRDQLKEALSELRRTLSSLRIERNGTAVTNTAEEASSEEYSNEAAPSLIHDITQLAATFQDATGLDVHTTLVDDLPELAPAQRLALFRATQELLTNVQRHADATDAWLDLSAENGNLSLTVADNGKGMPPQIEDGRFGLKGLQERAEQLDGQLTVGRSEAGGAQVRFTILASTPKILAPI